VHYNLKWFSPPNIVWALPPAVAASLKNTVPAFRPIKKPRLTHNPSTSSGIGKQQSNTTKPKTSFTFKNYSDTETSATPSSTSP
jgi:hypothetical protein